MRRLSHGALIVFALVAVVANIVHVAIGEFPVGLLVAFLSLSFFLVGLMLPNFNALAMEPLGAIAGTGSSFVGFAMTALGAILGGAVGQLYDGSAYPLFTGYCFFALISLVIVVITERGRLMHASPQHGDAAK